MKLALLLLLPVLGLTSCQASPLKGCGEDLRYRSISGLLDAGNAKLATGDSTAADALFEQGLAELGDRYGSPDVIDDSGMKLSLYRHQQKTEGDAATAPRKARILDGRLRAYRDRAAPQGCR